jgi:type II secretory pathway component PulL
MLLDGHSKVRGIPASNAISRKAVIVKAIKIKTEWASLGLTEDGSAILCAKYNGETHCVRFDSLKRLKQAMDTRKVSVKKWVVAIPKRHCILKTLTLPASDLDEASTMIEFELPSIIPLSMDEIVYGTTISNKQDNMLNVLVCILKTNTLNEFLKSYRAIGIEPHRIILDSLAIQNWFSNVDTIIHEIAICALVNRHNSIVQTCIDGNLHRANELISSRHDNMTYANEVFREILHQRKDLVISQKVKSVYLLAGEKEYVSEVNNLLCSIKHDSAYFGKVIVVSNPKIVHYRNNTKPEECEGEFIREAVIAEGLLDLALHLKLPHSNLISQKFTKIHKKRAFLLKHVITGILALVLVLFVWLNLVAMNWRIQGMSRMVESQIAPIADIAGKVDSKRQRVRAIQRQLSNRGQITAIVYELYRFTPKSITLSELNFTFRHNQASIDIKGQADMLSTAFDYTEAVAKAELLNGLQVKDAQQIPRPGGSVTVFKASCDIGNN